MATPPDVVVVRGRSLPPWAAALGGSGGPRVLTEDDVRTSDPGRLAAALEDAGCALIDGSVAIARVARQLHEIQPTLQLAAVVAPEEREHAQRALLFAPGVGELSLVAPGEAGPALVTRLADLTARRRAY
ncbi:MAG TPA: hypothetical protein VG432_09200, partial [Gemmatimonadaceae bacterium]|nr:hypothetical protein [Gemmatimonadaceae bacterium]